MLNKVDLIGRVGKDPEIKTTNNGNKVANFSLATSEKYKNEEKTEWHNIVIWGKLADIVERYVTKGQLLYLSGKITTRSYEDKDGNKKYITDIVCFNMKMLGGNSGNKRDNRQAAAEQQARDWKPEDLPNPDEDDLPFYPTSG